MRETRPPLVGKLALAARSLVEVPRAHAALAVAVDEDDLAAFEDGIRELDPDATLRLLHYREECGAVFLPEGKEGGIGVRLRFNARDVRALNRLEGEGGPVGKDDV